ncbi:hypothetical protein GCM10020229_53700 [Kitasatospora albolonga]
MTPFVPEASARWNQVGRGRARAAAGQPNSRSSEGQLGSSGSGGGAELRNMTAPQAGARGGCDGGARTAWQFGDGSWAGIPRWSGTSGGVADRIAGGGADGAEWPGGGGGLGAAEWPPPRISNAVSET